LSIKENRCVKQCFCNPQHNTIILLELHHNSNILKTTSINKELFLLPPFLIMMTSIYQRTERCSKTLCWLSPRNAFVCELWSQFWLNQNANGLQSKQNQQCIIVIPTEIQNFKVSCMNGPTIQQTFITNFDGKRKRTECFALVSRYFCCSMDRPVSPLIWLAIIHHAQCTRSLTNLYIV
jgi:hypothetical protein